MAANKNNNLLSISSEYIKNMYHYFKTYNDEITDLRNVSGLERERFRQHFNGNMVVNKYFHSTSNIYYRSTVIMAEGNYKVGHMLSSVADSDFIVVDRWYHEGAAKNVLKLFIFDKSSAC